MMISVRTLLENELGLTTPLDTNIHKNDQMLNFIASARGSEGVALSEYFTSGVQLLKIVEQIVRWRFGSFDGVSSLLDFASGYGRLTRFLVHRMPANRIWVSDIQADAVAFQEAEFGVHGFVSTIDPGELRCDQAFDCIFVASLFSHLPPRRFTGWLQRLYGMLKPGGLLLFTVHDERGLTSDEVMPKSGIWFSEGSEIASLSTQEYGRTVVTEAFVREAIVAASGRTEYLRIPYGLLFHQDIYIVCREPSPHFAGFDFAYLPHGAVDYALWAGPNELCLRGWAADLNEADSPVVIQLFVDGKFEQKCTPTLSRPDLREHFKDDRFMVSGWECSCRLPDGDPARVMAVKAISSKGVESLLYVGSVGSLLPVGKAELCLWLKPDELYVKGWAVDVSGSDSPVEVQIFFNGKIAQKVTPSLYRPELYEYYKEERFLRAGWECACQLEGADPGGEVAVKSVARNGDEALLYRGTIATLEAQGDEAFGHQREALVRLRADLQARLEYIRHLEAEIARKNVALERLEARKRRLPWQRD